MSLCVCVGFLPSGPPRREIEKQWRVVRMVEDKDFQQSIDDMNARSDAQRHDDYNNEMAGRDVGRIARFLPETAATGTAGDKRKAEREQAMNRLQLLLLNDPAYAAQYRETQEALQSAQTRLDAMMDQVQVLLAEAHTALQDTLDRAARLEDGRRVFRDKNGNVTFEDGTDVDEVLAASVVWRGDEPTLKEVNARKSRVSGLDELILDIQTGQAWIGDIQIRMQDESDPVTTDEMVGFKEEVETVVSDLDDQLAQEKAKAAPGPSVIERGSDVTTKILVPEI